MVANRPVAVSMNGATHSRSSASLLPKNGGGSIVEHSEFSTGRKIALPAGTVQLRSAVALANDPPRNHTGPDCPASQLAVSRSGWESTGKENAHCHHRALHSP